MERYLIVMKNKMIKQYLIHFPEVKEQFSEYTLIVNEIIDNLHHYYYQCFIEKTIKHEMPFVYKPLAFQIHKHFLEHKKKTTRKVVEEYIKSRDVQQLLFIINNMNRQSERSQKAKLYRKVIIPNPNLNHLHHQNLNHNQSFLLHYRLILLPYAEEH